MARVKLIKNYKAYKKGAVLNVSPNEAFGLLDSGVAIATKDLVPDDYKQAGDTNGSTTQLRSHKLSRR